MTSSRGLHSKATTAVIFLSGAAAGACVTFALVRCLWSPRRHWSWREWRAWHAKANGSLPTVPTPHGWTNGAGSPPGKGASKLKNNQNNHNGHNGSSAMLKSSDSLGRVKPLAGKKDALQNLPQTTRAPQGSSAPSRTFSSNHLQVSAGQQQNKVVGSAHSQLSKPGQTKEPAHANSPIVAPASRAGAVTTVPAALLVQGDDILGEQFTRNMQFFGEAGQMKVHNSFVVVVGLGGVGSHAAAALLRSGVGRLRLVDFDQVSLSSLNRHAVATRADVGTSKAECLEAHFLRIFPECDVDARVAMFDESTAEDILSGSPDFVLDCIDNIDTKVALLVACLRKNLPVLSAAGAGARADSTRIRIADLNESSEDPLARAVRNRLRRHPEWDGNVPPVPTVFSLERPKVKLVPFQAPNGEEADPLDYQVVPGFRVRVIPVLGAIPAMFGLAMAAHVLTKLAGMAVNTEPVVRLSADHYSLLFQRLIEREELRFRSVAGVEVDLEEIIYVVKELWRGRSFRDGSRELGRGMFRTIHFMTLTRWDQSKPASMSNLILCTFKEAEEHEATTLEDLKKQEPELYAKVEATLAKAREELGMFP